MKRHRSNEHEISAALGLVKLYGVSGASRRTGVSKATLHRRLKLDAGNGTAPIQAPVLQPTLRNGGTNYDDLLRVIGALTVANYRLKQTHE